MSSSNGTTYDLYHPLPPPPAPPQGPLPEAAFSLTLKGKMGGQDALLTVRGMTAAEFTHNLQAVRGLLDSPQAAAVPDAPGKGYCAKHQIHMTHNEKDGRTWYSHRLPEGGFCKGK
jgi:hypothetical protein